MLLKTINLKFTTNLKLSLSLIVLCSYAFASAQEVIEEGVVEKEVVKDTVTHKRGKIDGVVAVVGDYIVLDSDLDKQFAQLEASGVSKSDMPNRCQLFGKLLEDKLYAHHAVQDSIVVNDLEIRSQVDQQFNYILEQMDGSLPRMLNFYNKDTEESLRDEMFEINKSQQLASRMKEKIVNDIEVTPEEVR